MASTKAQVKSLSRGGDCGARVSPPLPIHYRSIVLDKFLGSRVRMVLVKISLIFCFVSY